MSRSISLCVHYWIYGFVIGVIQRSALDMRAVKTSLSLSNFDGVTLIENIWACRTRKESCDTNRISLA